MRAKTFLLFLAIVGLSQFAEAQNRVVIAVRPSYHSKRKLN